MSAARRPVDLAALRTRLAGGTLDVETVLLHLPDPDGDGPVVPDIPASSMMRARDSAELARRFASIVQSDPPADRAIPDGAASIYLRLGSPVEWKLSRALALAEGGETAILFSDGMGAIAAAVGFRLHHGAEIVAGVPLYGCTDNLFTNWLPRMGVVVHFADPADPASFAARFTRRTRVVYVETMSNPSLTLADLPGLKALVNAENERRLPGERITLVVDNTFATPYCCNPFRLDPPLEDLVVVNSTTKAINGFSAGLGGVAVIPWAYWKELFLYRKDHGGSLAPEQAHHLLTKSLRTLGIRLRRMQENAGAVAGLLAAHPAVAKTSWPGLPDHPQRALARRMLRDWKGNFAPGHMISFTMKGRTEEIRARRGRAVLDHLGAHSKVFLVAVSLGYIGTLIEDPNGGTHATIPPEERAARGIEPGLVRLSIGIEDPDDLLRDLIAALDHAGAA